MSYDPKDVDVLVRLPKRRFRAFGWEVGEAVSIVLEAVKAADKQDLDFHQTQCLILEQLDLAYEEWEAGALDKSELMPTSTLVPASVPFEQRA